MQSPSHHIPDMPDWTDNWLVKKVFDKLATLSPYKSKNITQKSKNKTGFSKTSSTVKFKQEYNQERPDQHCTSDTVGKLSGTAEKKYFSKSYTSVTLQRASGSRLGQTFDYLATIQSNMREDSMRVYGVSRRKPNYKIQSIQACRISNSLSNKKGVLNQHDCPLVSKCP
ncbi:hypothetical protein TNCV_573901 [Trichonephila clavipes]|nr:hypothetical protein TNCV_573901 [Trichonephila clavipes]